MESRSMSRSRLQQALNDKGTKNKREDMCKLFQLSEEIHTHMQKQHAKNILFVP
jgi:hypothetical protein